MKEIPVTLLGYDVYGESVTEEVTVKTYNWYEKIINSIHYFFHKPKQINDIVVTVSEKR